MEHMRVLTIAGHLGAIGGSEVAQVNVMHGLVDCGYTVDLLYVERGDLWTKWNALAAHSTRIRASWLDRAAPVRSGLGVLGAVPRALTFDVDVAYVHNPGDIPIARVVGCVAARPGGRPSAPSAPLPPTPVAEPIDPVVRPRDHPLRRLGSPLGGGGRPRARSCLGHSDGHRHRTVRTDLRPGAGTTAHDDGGRTRRSHDHVRGADPSDQGPGRAHGCDRPAGRQRPPRHLRRGVGRHLSGAPARQGQGRRVTFVDRQSDIGPLLAAADLVVLPSIVPETQGLVVSEAMAAGTPAIVSAVGGLSASLAGFPDPLVPEGDAAALAQAIRSHADWRVHDPELGPRSRQWVLEHLSLVHTVAQISEVLQDLRPG